MRVKIFTLVMLTLSVASLTGAEQTIRIGYIEFPPIFSTNDAGEPEGILIDLADMVLAQAGYAWEAKSFPTKRMVQNLVDGEIDLWIGLSTLPAFEGTTFIGESVVTTIELRAYMIGEKPPIKKKEELSGKSVIILKGYSYGGWINFITDPANHVKAVGSSNHESAFKMLLNERADYLLNYRLPSDKVLQTLTIPDLQFTTLSSFGVNFVVSKKMPQAREFLEALERSYQQLVEEGKWTP